MKRGNRAKIIGFLARMRRERLRCIQKGHYARARAIKAFLVTHAAMINAKDPV